MSKFNDNVRPARPTAVNDAGGAAYAQSDKLALVSAVLTSFVSASFYNSADKNLERIRSLVGKNDPLFAAKTAVYARNEFGMRSVSHVVAAEIAKNVKGEVWTKDFYNAVVRRPDDMAEILAAYASINGGSVHPTPNSLQKGLAKAFTKFDAYQLGKYRLEGKEISLVDVVRIVHPKNSEAIQSLVKGELKSNTYQTGLTQAGQKAETAEEKAIAKAEVWDKFVANPKKTEYFALLRNLRNIMEQASDETFDKALEILVMPSKIHGSLVLPFRFLTAYDQFDGSDARSRKVRQAIDVAAEISVDNVPVLNGNTLVAIDCSGSMGGGWGRWENAIAPGRIAALFGAALAKKNNSDVVTFDSAAKNANFDLNSSVITIANGFKTPGGWTNLECVFEKIARENKKYDRIIVLSDMNVWVGRTGQSAVKTYRSKMNVDPQIYCIDLSGTGTMQFPESKVYSMAGFSEKIFDIMGMLEQDQQAMINEIEKVQF